MAENTKISWAHHSFNPWVGCTKISPACDNCYAESWAKRTGHPELWQGSRRRTTSANWQQPIRWNRRAEAAGRRERVFCASLADVFDNQVSEEWRRDLWALIARTPHLNWLLLTKRPQNIAKMLPTEEPYRLPWNAPWHQWPWPNVWLGTTIENRREGARRAWELASVPAVVRFWSCEPLLEDLGDGTSLGLRDTAVDGRPAVSWVIAGGESGPKARPLALSWLRNFRDQCADANVSFFVKQLGARPRIEIPPQPGTLETTWPLYDRAGADMVEWPEDLRVQEFPDG